MQGRPRGVDLLVRAIILVLLVGIGLPSVVAGSGRTFTLNFKRAPIEKVIERIGSETRRTIIFDERVRGNISIVTKRPVTEDEAWAILDAALSIIGFSLLPSTVDNWRISRVADAVGEAPFVSGVEGEMQSFVTTLIPLKAVDLRDAMNVLEPLSGSRVTLVPFEPSHSVIASGPEREIGRLITIADELNRVDDYELRARVLRYRDVEEVERIVEARIESEDISERVLQVWSDQRTNAILYRGIDEEVTRLERFLDRLDEPIEGGGRIRILRVLNRDPEEIADLINDLGRSSGAVDGVDSDSPSTLAGADFSLAVDKASRSIVVRADEATQIAIREMLETLDVQPQLIGVDITISELRTPSSFNLGFGFSLPFSAGDDFSAIVVSAPPGGLLAVPDSRTTVFGRVAHDNGVPFTIDAGDGIEIPILQTGVIRGGQFSVRSDVLMKPSLIVTVGERHEIFVGTNIPVPVSDTSSTSGSGGGGLDLASLSQTVVFERTDIGITLGVEATAGKQGKIQLDLDLDLSSIAPSAAGNIEEVGPTFIHQTLNTVARLEDGETAVVAVSREGVDGKARSGVPWLSDIPFLGWFFSTDEGEDRELRLVIAARARRISTPAELAADTIRRRLALQRRNARGKAFPSLEGPPYGVRVTTREREDDARVIQEGLRFEGHNAIVHEWTYEGSTFFDVYIVALPSMADAAEIANELGQDGWEVDLVVLPSRS